MRAYRWRQLRRSSIVKYVSCNNTDSYQGFIDSSCEHRDDDNADFQKKQWTIVHHVASRTCVTCPALPFLSMKCGNQSYAGHMLTELSLSGRLRSNIHNKSTSSFTEGGFIEPRVFIVPSGVFVV